MKSKIALVLWLATFALKSAALPPESVCHGSSKDGTLENGVELPRTGPNFQAYSYGSFLSLGGDRTFVHSKVLQIVVATYNTLATELKDKKFIYGETGARFGGPFKPHHEHQNGTAVDFMVPVVDSAGRSVSLPCAMSNYYCYHINFDADGRQEQGSLRIDFEAMAAHLHHLSRIAAANGAPIRRVIFAGDLLDNLKAASRFDLRGIAFQTKAWVDHDEHYHVDFGVPCKR